MAELIYGPDLERSIRLYELLYKSGKLCTIPDCPQQKCCSNNSDLCFAHQQVSDGHLLLKTPEKESHYEHYE